MMLPILQFCLVVGLAVVLHVEVAVDLEELGQVEVEVPDDLDPPPGHWLGLLTHPSHHHFQHHQGPLGVSYDACVWAQSVTAHREKHAHRDHLGENPGTLRVDLLRRPIGLVEVGPITGTASPTGDGPATLAGITTQTSPSP